MKSFQNFLLGRKRKLHDDDKVEEYFLRRRKANTNMINTGVLNIAFSHQSKKSQ